MYKFLQAAIFLFLSLTVPAQTEATTKDGKKVILNTNGTWMYADCAQLIKTVSVSGKVLTTAKDHIKITKDNGVSGIEVILIQGSEPQSAILNFTTLGREIHCLTKNAKGIITFTDGTDMPVTHMGDLNCNGNFSLFMGPSTGNASLLNVFRTKKIKTISLEYTGGEEENYKKVMKETVFPDAEAEKIMRTIQCLSN